MHHLHAVQVVNMVCEECGKPCRNKTQQDLHSKHTGHTKYVDKVKMTFRVKPSYHSGDSMRAPSAAKCA